MCGFPVQTFGKSRESKIPLVKILVLIHSVCPYKNYTIGAPNSPTNYFSQCVITSNTLSRKKSGYPQIGELVRSLLGPCSVTCMVEPYNASILPIVLFLANWIKVVRYILYVHMMGIPHFSRSTWVENIANI